MRIGLVVATHGRPKLVQQYLSTVARQVRLPDEVVLSVANDDDLASDYPKNLNLRVVYSSPGLCAQRNKGLEAVKEKVDVILFTDDDFWMCSNYLQELDRIFSNNPDIVATTGLVLADGAAGRSISIADAEAGLREHEMNPPQTEDVRDMLDTFGCNMAFRADQIGNHRFDERLPLYGWQEDVDFSARLRPHGRIVWTNALAGIHLGSKAAKINGLRFGYSQVVNPLYIFKKGNMSLGRATSLMFRNIAANAAKSVFPERNVDRWGRLKGNMIALFHVSRGRLDPTYILKL
jgi:GT2 family glycosyltransferase